MLSCMLFCYMSLVLFSGVYLFICSLWVCVIFCCECFSDCFRMSSTVSTMFILNWSQRYCSAIMGVAFTCSVPCDWPVFYMHIMYDLLLWLWTPLPSTVLWVHGPPFPHKTATVDPNRIEAKLNFLEVSWLLSFFVFWISLHNAHHHYLN